MPGMGEGDRSRSTDGARERQRVLLLCAGIIVLFAATDWITLGYFSWRPLAVRLAWSLFIALTAWSLRGADAKRVRDMMLALAVLSSALCTALAALTGGVASSLFHVMLALPVVVALVIQDQPGATVASGVTLLGGGVGILIASGATLHAISEWGGQAVVFTLVAAYARPATASCTRARPRSAAPAPRPPPARARPRRPSPRATSSWPSPPTSCARR